ncbi:hypothetical protein Hanom_Chr09g00831451 [Helianthus anomalus]
MAIMDSCVLPSISDIKYVDFNRYNRVTPINPLNSVLQVKVSFNTFNPIFHFALCSIITTIQSSHIIRFQRPAIRIYRHIIQVTSAFPRKIIYKKICNKIYIYIYIYIKISTCTRYIPLHQLHLECQLHEY